MKKFVVILLCLTACLSLACCNAERSSESTGTSEVEIYGHGKQYVTITNPFSENDYAVTVKNADTKEKLNYVYFPKIHNGTPCNVPRDILYQSVVSCANTSVADQKKPHKNLVIEFNENAEFEIISFEVKGFISAENIYDAVPDEYIYKVDDGKIEITVSEYDIVKETDTADSSLSWLENSVYYGIFIDVKWNDENEGSFVIGFCYLDWYVLE